MDSLQALADKLTTHIKSLPLDRQVEALNYVRREIHLAGPFRDHPVDCTLWVTPAAVVANDYNPNTVAPPEMKLLETSIEADGYTQPIVTMPDGETHEVVDGFHRHRVGRESLLVMAQTHGYLPIVEIREGRANKSDRMASTIRHNRARGKHGVPAMTEIVRYLAQKNWTNQKIARELGMEPDEVLRFRQVGGLAAQFARREYSEAWDINPGD